MNKTEEQGYNDAIAGHTACPFGQPELAKLWAKGHDRAHTEVGTEARFARTAGKRR